MKKIIEKWNSASLILRIVIGLIAGTLLGMFLPQLTFLSLFGSLFVGALKAVAPVLVFFLVASALCQSHQSHGGVIKTVVLLYVLSTVIASTIAAVASFVFPVDMVLVDLSSSTTAAPAGIMEVIENTLLNMVQNPIKAIAEGNYIGILTWAVLFGLIFKTSAPATKNLLTDISNGLSKAVSLIISLAPLGIMGLSYSNMIDGGFSAFATYGKLILLLVGCMAFQYFVTNSILVYWCIRKNPFPLVLYCLRKSAVTAFFTRSSAANIPVNMEAAAEMGLDKDTYSVTIPLGSTVNMDGAAITITVMTLATCHTLGISVDLGSAILLSLLASVAAAGASGVAGGSLLLIPLACSLFGIPDTISMQVVGVGFIISVIQDSVETALNSSSDLLLTASSEYRQWRRQGRKIPF